MKGHVQFLDNPPTRPHEVIGIITPPAGEYETEAEAVKAMRAQGSEIRSDVIFGRCSCIAKSTAIAKRMSQEN